jgi:hypothetical protein
VSEPGRLFTREQIEAALWPDVTVTEDSLTQAVRRVRIALGEDPKRPRFIETVPRRGYRWVGAVVSERGTVPPPRRSLSRPEDAFVGRQPELEQLRDALQVPAGHPRGAWRHRQDPARAGAARGLDLVQAGHGHRRALAVRGHGRSAVAAA